MRFLLMRAILGIFFIMILFFIIAYARGYRLSLSEQKLTSTGILAVSSSPDGAKIILNDRFKGATNTNLTLTPGRYNIRLTKDGYTSWSQTLAVKGEIVTKIDAVLFPQNPSLSPLTSLGVVKAHYFPNSNKVFFISDNIKNTTAAAALEQNTIELEKNGLYVLDIGKKPLSIFNPLKLLVAKSSFPAGIDIANAMLSLSPDGKQLIYAIKNKAGVELASYLLSADEKNIQPFDITRSKKPIETAWTQKEREQLAKILETYKKPLPMLAQETFEIIAFSPDETKILYIANADISLPIIIAPPLVGSNQTPETRNITRGNLYVYDKKEDKNYEIIIPSSISTIKNGQNNQAKKILDTKYSILNNIFWYPDSTHLIIKEENNIAIMDYDGTQKQTVYSGPFEKDFLAVSSDGKLLILANLNPKNNQYPDVYAVGIR